MSARTSLCPLVLLGSLLLALALLAPAAGAAPRQGSAYVGTDPGGDGSAMTFSQSTLTCVNTQSVVDAAVAAGGKPLGYTIDTSESDKPDFTAQIDWGDGTADSVRVTEQKVYVVEHPYTDPGEYEVTFRADGSIGSEACSNPEMKVANLTALPDYTTRLSGLDRLSTSAAISKDLWGDDAARSVTLARADQFPDALAGAALAVAKQGPLLLTPADQLAPVTKDELLRVLPESATVYLLGGEAALGSEVEDAVANLGYDPVRLGGGTRLETATRIAEEITDEPSTIFLTWGFNFPDALVAGAVAGNVGGVVLLTEEGAPGDATAAYLDDHPDIDRVAIGGVARDAVPEAEAIVGANRFATSAEVARIYYPDAISFAVASGATFPDALSGGAHAGALGIPLLLSGEDLLPVEVTGGTDDQGNDVEGYFNRDNRTYDPGYLYGGRAALSQEVAAVASIYIAEP